MAGVYIKDAELPDACWNCGWDPCVLWKEDRGDLLKHPNCPLVEVPDHGDLIDESYKVDAHYYNDKFGEWSIKSKTVGEVLAEICEVLPKVVIPADRSEE